MPDRNPLPLPLDRLRRAVWRELEEGTLAAHAGDAVAARERYGGRRRDYCHAYSRTLPDYVDTDDQQAVRQAIRDQRILLW